MLRLDHVLVLREDVGDVLSFAFRGRRWSIYTFLISITLLVGTIVIKGLPDVHYKEYLIPGGYVASAAFIWSSIYSFYTKITLDIDSAGRLVRYRKSNIFGDNEWERGFSDFSEIRIWRPGRKSFFKVILRIKDNQEIPLGTNEAGTLNLDRSKEIAERISKVMGLPVIEESTVRREL